VRKTRETREGYKLREFRVTPDKDLNRPINTGGNSKLVASGMQKKKYLS